MFDNDRTSIRLDAVRMVIDMSRATTAFTEPRPELKVENVLADAARIVQFVESGNLTAPATSTP